MAEVTEQQLAQRSAERRAEVAKTKATATSAKPAGAHIEAREDSCGDCRAEYRQTKLPSGNWVPNRCPECHPPKGAEREVESGYRGNILEDLYAAGVNVWKYQQARLQLFDPEHDPEALRAAEDWIAAWQDSPRRRFAPRDWMFFFGAGSTRTGKRDVRLGKLGNGKTFLAVAIARELIERQLLDPKRFVFRTAETILIESEATFKAQSDESEKRLLSFYERPELLVIDDLGVRHDPTPHAVRLFDELTKRREAKATIWTSNLSIRVLAGSGETMKRIADRIAGECGDGARYVVEFSGPSRRRQRSVRQIA